MKKIFVVLAVLFLAPALQAGWSVSSTQTDSDTLEVTVTPSQGEKWNDLKIPCNSGDVAGDFTIDPPTSDWEADRVEKVGQRHYVVLEYDDLNTEKGGADTITIDGPDNRTGCGTFIVTLNGANVYSTSRDGNGSRLPGFCSAGMDFSYDADGSGVVTVYYVDSTADQVRAVALDITTDNDANITAVDNVNAAYNIYPGSIDINELTGEVNHPGSAVCDAVKYPNGTLPGLYSYGTSVEMGSLYVGDGNAPEDNGVLLTFTVDKSCTGTIAGNVIRGSVVLENPNADPCDNLPIVYEVVIETCGDCPEDSSSWMAGTPDGWIGPEDVAYILDIIDDYPLTGYYVGPTDPNFDECLDFSSWMAGTPDGWLGPEDVAYVLDIIDDYPLSGYYVQCPAP